MEFEPPLLETYNTLLRKISHGGSKASEEIGNKLFTIEECELPVIDLSCLNLGHEEREKCMKEIANASSSWGFFLVVNHGVPMEVLKSMLFEEMKMFQQPFNKKAEQTFMNLPANSYLWGNPFTTSPKQILWQEAFQIPLTDISKFEELDDTSSLRSTLEVYANEMTTLAKCIAEILAENLGMKSSFFQENFSPSTCSLRMNRYPPCPFPPEQVFGYWAHTDSDFLTVLSQDQVGGLQLVNNGIWHSVKPRADALVVNIGDLCQAWSNGVYKSVEHRVIASGDVERFSVAYAYCPSNETVIKSCFKPAIYRNFSFGEYRQQCLDDFKATGTKIGLSRFLL